MSNAPLHVFQALTAATIIAAIAAVVLPIVGIVELIRGHNVAGGACIAIGVLAALGVAWFLGFV